MTAATAPALGRHPHFDERSREYPVRTLLPRAIDRRKRVWTLPGHFPLDQGREGACVGFGWSAELSATPVKINTNNTTARNLYRQAQAEDRAMGNHWAEGASVLAGAKACHRDNTIKSYRWAFGIDDVIDTIVARGPVVLGLNWYSGMYEAPNGLVTVGGPLVGGHCLLANGYIPDHPEYGEVVVWTNSWGSSYGQRGQAVIKVNDLERLLQEQGEGCIAVDNRGKQSWWETVKQFFNS